MKKKLISVLLSAMLVSSAWAIETPAGYTPWFSVDGAWVPGTFTIPQPTEMIPDWRAIQVIAVASNVAGDSPASDPSPEVLIAPTGTVAPVQGWPGAVVAKGSTPLKVRLTQPTGGTPTRYTFFVKSRTPIGTCAKPVDVQVIP